MKKTYESPTVEKIRFNYSEQVVAASGSGCYWKGNDDSYYTHAMAGCQDNYHESLGAGETVPA